MVRVSAGPRSILLEFSSDITFVEYAVDILNNLLAYQGIADPTNLLIVCRELIKNAVVHGNRNEPEKTVVLRLDRLEDERYRVDIEDEGDGFDGRSQPVSLPEQFERHGCCGYVLIHTLSEKVGFNTKGNKVTVYLYA